MNVVSLAPSATETIVALGAGDRIAASVESRNAPAHSDILGGWLTSDVGGIERYDPDLVITTDALQDAQRKRFEDELPTLHLDPRTLNDVIDSIRRLADRIGYGATGEELCIEIERRLTTVRANAVDPRPVVYCEEWSSPPMVSGNWIADVVSTAGGKYPFTDPNDRSREITREEFETHNPDIAILNICGEGNDVTIDRITNRGWSAPAVPNHVYVVDDLLLNQPSPWLFDGVERLHEIIRDWAK